MSLISLFQQTVEKGGSDLHLAGGERPMIRINGDLQDAGASPLSDAGMSDFLKTILTKEQLARFSADLELDAAILHEGERFRINIHQEAGHTALAARHIPRRIPTPALLRFEPSLLDMTSLLDGLILVVGPTGCGKSTTIAAMIEEINAARRAHIITIEDPVEFVFADKQSLVEQREVGVDTHSFASALKHVLRQDPDVIFVGEMRDPETIATVLTAAETGHLVFSTLHTGTAAEAVERIVDVFDGAKQRQTLIQLSAVLRAVVAQQLVPGTDGRLAPAREILMNTPAVANLIRENNIAQIKSMIQTGKKDGMQTMEQSLAALQAAGVIAPDVAQKRSGRARRE